MTDVVIFADASSYETENQIRTPIRMAGTFRIATEIRHLGLSCQLVDYFFSFNEDEITQICKKFIKNDTVVVGFSTMFWFLPQLNYPIKNTGIKFINKVINYIKETYPHIKIVIGGSQINDISKIHKFDKIFLGFADDDFLKYICKLTNKEYKKFDFRKSQIIYQPEDYINDGDAVTIEISRGCIFKCKFCAFPLNGKKKFDYIKDIEILKEELLRNYDDFKITNYFFSDDTFNDSTYKLELINDMFKTLPFEINFTCYLRLDLLYRYQEQIQLLKEMGIKGAFFGIETLNYESAKCIGKGIRPEIIKQFLYDLKTDHWGQGINITIGLIVGLPYETYNSLDATINWIKDECVIDSVVLSSLWINPDKNEPWRSEFEINSEKYGYRWPEGSSSWINNFNEIKSLEDAQKYAKFARDEFDKRNISASSGNFVLFTLSNLAKYSSPKLSLNDIINMSKEEKASWRKLNYFNCSSSLFKDYKSKLLGKNYE